MLRPFSASLEWVLTSITMAEIGVIASVIGVAGAGFRLSLILNAVGAEVANAGVEIHTISKGVTLFSLMLKQVGQHLQSPQSVHSSEAIETAQTITHECQLVFDEISEMLDKVQTRKRDGTPSPTIQQRFKWCFKKHRVTYLLAQLESLKMSLLVMLQILQLGKLMVTPPHSEAKQDVAQKEDTIQQERAETQNIVIVRFWAISRLDRLYHAAEQEDIADRKTELEAYNQTVLEGTQPQLAIEAPPSPTSSALIRLPTVSLGELDQTLNRIKDSPRDMIQVSESVIDPLLQRWTRCYDILGHTNGRATNGPKFTPSVHDLIREAAKAS
ncbi:hypothetical protein UCRPC4_g05228 [Phaeomoniella chlamydospora]|uniref:Fungal N-terminal domain-containing protein n=1 Tax=Phaeomoniella chlamydospora TaxID=158046 RepID=A0A0G2GMD7_PHACM|nr:hypothetical protein UCRPC4_g05228 [Phaeomoniella chlamydospora]